MWSKIKKTLYEHRYAIAAGVGIVTLGFLGLHYLIRENDIKLSAFLQALKNNYVEEVIVEGKTILFRSQNDQMWHKTFLGSFPIKELYNIFNTKKLIFSIRQPGFAKEDINAIIGTLMLGSTMVYMVNESKVEASSSVQMNPKIYQNNYSFQDFYGGDIIKLKFRQIINFMREPAQYEKFGARIRRGVLFYGPPGTGKTMLARALANEAKCEFIKVAASEFQEIFVGVGARRVRELFKEARACQNGCIIFIDQIDALGSRLNHLRDTHQTTSTINQFLSEMDGFSQLDKVVVVAATNRPDLVDAAILRAGRFDLKIQINLPCKEQRLGIITKIVTKRLKNNVIDDQVLNDISQKTEGWCGADLEALVNESIYKAIKDEKNAVGSEHLWTSFEEMQSRFKYNVSV